MKYSKNFSDTLKQYFKDQRFVSDVLNFVSVSIHTGLLGDRFLQGFTHLPWLSLTPWDY